MNYWEQEVWVEIESIPGIQKLSRERIKHFKRLGVKVTEKDGPNDIKEEETKTIIQNEQGGTGEQYKWAVKQGIIRESLSKSSGNG